MTGLSSTHMYLYCGGYFPTDLHVNWSQCAPATLEHIC